MIVFVLCVPILKDHFVVSYFGWTLNFPVVELFEVDNLGEEDLEL